GVVGATRLLHVLELRPGHAVERPAFRTMLAGRRGRAVERTLALAAIEARHVAAREHGPHHATAREVDAARAVALVGRQVDFGERRLARVRSGHQADDVARLIDPREADVHRLAPDRIVDRAWLNAIERRHHPLVLGRVERLVGLDILVAFAV